MAFVLLPSAVMEFVKSLFAAPEDNEKQPPVFAGVEGGGTTWRAAIAVGSPENIQERQTFKTTTPEETLSQIRAWLDARPHDALGVATFGPIEPKKENKLYGYITSTPKPKWHNTNVLGSLWDGVKPCRFDTDVNAPALAEFAADGVPAGHTSCAYVTVGTGVGVGLVVNNETVHGLLHPEMGHVCLKRAEGDTFEGVCPYHKDCVEGLVSAPSIAKRAGITQDELPSLPITDDAWDKAAHTLASLCATMILTVSPDTIILSGGVMQNAALFPKIHEKCLALLNGYVQRDRLLKTPETVIKPSRWGNNAGIIGALTLSQLAYVDATKVK